MTGQTDGRGPIDQCGARPGSRRSRQRSGLVVCGVVLAAGLLGACAPQVRFHGFAPADHELAAIEVGRATRADVAAALGRPGATGAVDESTWFYVASRWEQRPPRPSVEVEREVVAVSFDGRGVVRNIERFGLEDGEVVALSRRVTETTVRQPGLLGQLLRNVGQFRADQFID
ncbi:MAG: outer membrane protein assembly factor BamE domain-containing protein [Alkalilacustris sp.]